ncbi:hypothetical protein [Microcoleus asticus]|uniref:hypothetical protein n=1 Tax=Microcoleus asticus TaxID=2815231 RepID=UPI001552BB2F|nr:hypothetical protein [Microcoleus asticus]
MAFWESAIGLVLEIACPIARPVDRTFSVAPGRSQSHLIFSPAKPASFVEMLSESGKFSRSARLYKFAIGLLIYQ